MESELNLAVVSGKSILKLKCEVCILNASSQAVVVMAKIGAQDCVCEHPLLSNGPSISLRRFECSVSWS